MCYNTKGGMADTKRRSSKIRGRFFKVTGGDWRTLKTHKEKFRTQFLSAKELSKQFLNGLTKPEFEELYKR
jgi:hypothetical protein